MKELWKWGLLCWATKNGTTFKAHGSKILNKICDNWKHPLLFRLFSRWFVCRRIQIILMQFHHADFLGWNSWTQWKGLFRGAVCLKHNMWSKPHANDVAHPHCLTPIQVHTHTLLNTRTKNIDFILKEQNRTMARTLKHKKNEKERYSLRHHNLFTLTFSKSKSFFSIFSIKCEVSQRARSFHFYYDHFGQLTYQFYIKGNHPLFALLEHI